MFSLLTEVAENRARSLAAHHAGPSARDAAAHRERPQRTAPTRPQAGARAAHPTRRGRRSRSQSQGSRPGLFPFAVYSLTR